VSENSEKCKKISEKRTFFLKKNYSKEVKIYKYNGICQEKTNDKLFGGEEGEVDEMYEEASSVF
jgi:hypothetical protein